MRFEQLTSFSFSVSLSCCHIAVCAADFYYPSCVWQSLKKYSPILQANEATTTKKSFRLFRQNTTRNNYAWCAAINNRHAVHSFAIEQFTIIIITISFKWNQTNNNNNKKHSSSLYNPSKFSFERIQQTEKKYKNINNEVASIVCFFSHSRHNKSLIKNKIVWCALCKTNNFLLLLLFCCVYRIEGLFLLFLSTIRRQNHLKW